MLGNYNVERFPHDIQRAQIILESCKNRQYFEYGFGMKTIFESTGSVPENQLILEWDSQGRYHEIDRLI